MLKKIILNFLVISSFTNCFGQTENTGTVRELLFENYIDYYQQIAKAEEAIIVKDYKNAILIYSTTFNKYSYNNPIDCYVAAQVAAYQADTTLAKTYILKAISFGTPIKTIEHNPHLISILNLIDQQLIDSTQIVYKNRINQEARKLVIALSKRDQELVREKKSIYDKSGFRLKENYQPAWDSLLLALSHIINLYGFPSQKIIGTHSESDRLFKVNPHSNYAYFILIHHCNSWKLLGDILLSELKKGNLTPQMYGAIYQYSNNQNPTDLPIQYFASRPCQNKKCEQKLNSIGRTKVDEDRWNIGLCSYDIMEKKFEQNRKYYLWKQNQKFDNQPYFDFKCDLNFFQD